MSCSNLPKTAYTHPIATTSSNKLFPVKIPHHCAQKTSKHPWAWVYLADGQTLFQTHSSRPHSGDGTHRDTSEHEGDQKHNSADKEDTPAGSDISSQEDGFIHILDYSFDPSSPHWQKCHSQSECWLTEVISSLVNPYMELLHSTENLSLEMRFFYSTVG
uniref:Uncharacterized protein n=1 Tax=Moniliophthora roreri TaxID=221103 RepID=A0A0W0GE51_MONRR